VFGAPEINCVGGTALAIDVDGFSSRYARAREAQMREWSDEIVEISNNEKLDPHDRRVRIDTKKWLMSKLAPKRYGDKLTIAGDPAAPLLHIHQLDEMISSMSAPELDALERFAQERLKAIEARDEEPSGRGRIETGHTG
jgi:hypothetical protein